MQLANFLKNLHKPETLIVADSAEPKSIDELRSFGLNVLPAAKGKDSVMAGIQRVQDQKISFTKRSINIRKEYLNYLFYVDPRGKIMNMEDPKCANHHMAGIRYAVSSMPKLEQPPSYFDRIWKDELVAPGDKPQLNMGR